MFDFWKNSSKVKNKELDAVIQKMQMNIANNYKDAAQINLKEFERLLEELASFQQRMKQFTHKDQKPTWI